MLKIPINGYFFYVPITYNVFNSPVSISEDGVEKVDFEYNPFNQRAVMYYGNLEKKASRLMKKFYSADGTMEIRRKTASGSTTDEFVIYIGGDGYTAPVILKSDGTNKNYYYLHRDYQGSILAITNADGNIVEKRIYDVWGGMVAYSNGSTTTIPTTGTAMFLDRGYTGHEHILGVGLINMNGRIYDPKLHRFLQPDDNIQDPTNTQNFNRFGYCMNNPTKYSDPSGESWLDFAGFIFSAWVHGSQATGQANPLKWNAGEFANAAMSAFSVSINIETTNFANGYVDNYNQQSATVARQGNNVENYPYVATAWISPPTQHYLLGMNMTAMSKGGFFAKMFYDGVNQINIFGQILIGRSIADSSIKNLNGTYTATDEGVMAVGSLPLFLVGGGEFEGLAFEAKEGLGVISESLTLAAEETISVIDDVIVEGTHSVYQGFDKAGILRYVGITGREEPVRFGEHLASGTAKSQLQYRVIDGATGLSKTQARVWEQNLINEFGLQKGGGQLLNKYNSIAPKNWWLHDIK